MKFAVITLATAMFAAAPVQAQQQEGQRRPEARAERKDPTQRIERRVQRLDEKLNLSDDQVARIRTILTKESEQMRAHFEKSGFRRDRAEGARPQPNPAVRDSVRAQMKAMRDRTDQAVQQVLSADQRTAYQKLQQEMRERGGERRGKRAGTRKS
jgi:hypothetical protein